MTNPQYFLPKGISPAITPSDSDEIDTRWSNGVLAEQAGDFAVEYEDGSTHTWTVVSIPFAVYGRIKKVLSTGTTIGAGYLFTFSVGI